MTELLEAVKRILWEEWDPIGVNDIAPDDEYDSYAFRVLVMMKEGRSEKEVADYLNWVAAEHMSLGGHGRNDVILRDARSVARKIFALRENK